MSYYKVTIGHAVSNENNKSSNGKPGDQKQNKDNTYGELLFQDWYISGGKRWDCVLRCKDNKKRKLIADDAIKAVRNEDIGYSQDDRYALYDDVKDEEFDCSKTDKAVDCDCSSLATVCSNYAGIPIPRDTYTGNMKTRYSNTKQFKIYTANKYVTKDNYLKVGDILLRAGHHTAIVVNTLYHLVRQLRYTSAMMSGADIKALQYRLNELNVSDTPLVVDGIFGKKTDEAIRKFQSENKLAVDGIVGKNTAKALGFLYC